jgi:hypothetical protein
MGNDLYQQGSSARELFELADSILGFSLSKICFEGPEDELRQTRNTQPAIVLHSMVLVRALEGLTLLGGPEVYWGANPKFIVKYDFKLGKVGLSFIHSEDVARFIHEFYRNPRRGEVYNLGGGKGNSCSVLEAFDITASFTGNKQVYSYVEQNRIGDHICYYSDLRKMKAHYPQWDITRSLTQTIEEIVRSWQKRLAR